MDPILRLTDAVAARSIDGPTLTISLAVISLIATGLFATGLGLVPPVTASAVTAWGIVRRGGILLATAGLVLVVLLVAPLVAVAATRSIDGPTLTISLAVISLIATSLVITGLTGSLAITSLIATGLFASALGIVPCVGGDGNVGGGRISTRIRS